MKTTRKLRSPLHRCKPNIRLARESENSERFWFAVSQAIKHFIALVVGAFSTTTVTYEMPPTWWRIVLWIVIFYISFSYFLYIIVGDKMFQFETGPRKFSK